MRTNTVNDLYFTNLVILKFHEYLILRILCNTVNDLYFMNIIFYKFGDLEILRTFNFANFVKYNVRKIKVIYNEK